MKKELKIFWGIVVIVITSLTFYFVGYKVAYDKMKKNQLSFDEQAVLLKGVWEANGTQYQLISKVDENGNPVYANDTDIPYYLVFNADGTFTIILNEITDSGTYLNLNGNDKKIYLNLNNNNDCTCELENNTTLHCDLYASTFVKK